MLHLAKMGLLYPGQARTHATRGVTAAPAAADAACAAPLRRPLPAAGETVTPNAKSERATVHHTRTWRRRAEDFSMHDNRLHVTIVKSSLQPQRVKETISG